MLLKSFPLLVIKEKTGRSVPILCFDRIAGSTGWDVFLLPWVYPVYPVILSEVLLFLIIIDT
jgi:hypothetical protein